MEDQTTLEAKLTRLAELKAEEAKLAPIKQEVEQLRYDIQDIMQKSGSMRTKAAAGYFAVREERKTLTITDTDALSAWIDENTMDPMAYYKLDAAPVKLLAEETLKDAGELIPGVQEVANEIISIRKAKA